MAVDYFLKIDDIKGESTAEGYEDWIIIESFSLGLSNAGSAIGGGGRVSKPAFQDVEMTKFIDKATPDLFLRCASGSRYLKVTLAAVGTGGGDDGSVEKSEYLVYHFTDVLISSYVANGSGGDEPRPVESVSFNFTKIDFEYRPAAGAPVKAGWDLKANKKV